jgi:hypothetical protein
LHFEKKKKEREGNEIELVQRRLEGAIKRRFTTHIGAIDLRQKEKETGPRRSIDCWIGGRKYLN